MPPPCNRGCLGGRATSGDHKVGGQSVSRGGGRAEDSDITEIIAQKFAEGRRDTDFIMMTLRTQEGGGGREEDERGDRGEEGR